MEETKQTYQTIRKKYTEDTYITFYYFPDNKESKWQIEEENIKQSGIEDTEHKAIKSYEIPGFDWRLIETNQGYRYFFNPFNLETTWEVPKELKHLDLFFNKEKENIDENENDNIEMNEDDVAYQLQMMGMDPNQFEEEEDNEMYIPPEVLYHQNVLQFEGLLKQLQVTGTDTWELFLPRLQQEEIFKSIDDVKLCRSIFENYCKQLIKNPELAPKEKQINKQLALDAYRELVKEDITYKSEWIPFNKKHFEDERSKSISYKEREKIFLEVLQPLVDAKKKEKEEKKLQKEKKKKDYIEMLKEIKDLRYDSSWRKTKTLIEKDQRYLAIDSNTEKEYLFRDYVATLKTLGDDKKKDKYRDFKK